MTIDDLTDKLFKLEKSITTLITNLSNTNNLNISLPIFEEKQLQLQNSQKLLETRLKEVEIKANRDSFWKGCCFILMGILVVVFSLFSIVAIIAANESAIPEGYESLVKDVEILKSTLPKTKSN